MEKISGVSTIVSEERRCCAFSEVFAEMSTDEIRRKEGKDDEKQSLKGMNGSSPRFRYAEELLVR